MKSYYVISARNFFLFMLSISFWFNLVFFYELTTLYIFFFFKLI